VAIKSTTLVDERYLDNIVDKGDMCG